MSADRESQRAKIQLWLEGFHRASATLDAAKWCGEFMTDDVELQYANSHVIKGADVQAMFAQVLPQLDRMEHEIVYFDYVEPKIYQAARIRYLVKGDDPSQVIDIPGFATFFVREEAGGALKCYRSEVYLDATQVFARIAEKSSGKS